MTYFNSDLKTPVPLPDGTIATTSKQIDRYLKQNNLTMASDYSDAFFERKRFEKQAKQKAQLFALFLKNYKRSIWK